MRDNKTKLIVLTGLFAALITVATGLSVTIPIGHGYIHLGDTFIYLAASILPAPFAILAAAIGGGFADLLAGYGQYIIPTMIIKSVLVTLFTSKNTTWINKRNIIGIILAIGVTAGGYFVAETIMYGGVAGGLPGVFGNVVQAVGSGILYLVIGKTLDTMPSVRRSIVKEN